MKKFLFILLMILPLMLFAQSDGRNSEIIDQDVIVMPTASTIKNHNGILGSYEFLYNKIGLSIAQKTNVEVYTSVRSLRDLFFYDLTLGIKQNYYDTDYYKGAIIGLYQFKEQSTILGTVSSFGFQNVSFHLSGIFIKSFKKDDASLEFITSLGSILYFAKNTAFLFEYDGYMKKNNNEYSYYKDNDNSFIGVGLRIK